MLKKKLVNNEIKVIKKNSIKTNENRILVFKSVIFLKHKLLNKIPYPIVEYNKKIMRKKNINNSVI